MHKFVHVLHNWSIFYVIHAQAKLSHVQKLQNCNKISKIVKIKKQQQNLILVGVFNTGWEQRSPILNRRIFFDYHNHPSILTIDLGPTRP